MKIFPPKQSKIAKNELTAQKIWKERVDKKAAEMSYFCPFCRTLFDSPNCYKMQRENDNLLYLCVVCKDKRIEAKDYEKQRKNGKNYKLCGGGKKDAIDKFIKEAVLELGRQGFSVEEIYSITHFSRERIYSIISEIKPSVETYSVKEFFMGKLEATRYEYEKLQTIMKKHNKNDEEKQFVKGFLDKAINLGCNYDALSILFGMSKRDIATAIREFEQESTRDKLLELCTRRRMQTIKITARKSKSNNPNSSAEAE